MKLGLLGGSFNPIHHGHLVIATRAAEAVKLDRVLFIPTAISPLKRGRGVASPSDRWAMVRLALRGNPLFEADDLELRRGGVSYTIDTLRELGLRRPSADLHLILGADATRLLPRWKALDEIRRRVTFVVISRPGYGIRGGMAKHSIDSPLLEISSSEIRERARKGLSLRYLVPEAVERYIRKKGLYR
jgi:nicotinate-nucleotide adenylyltransferase